MPPPKPIEQYESIATWQKGLAEQWGGDPLAEEPDKLRAVEGFCEFVERDPDELVAFCFLRRKQTGEKFGSVKRREEVAARLREYRARWQPQTEARRCQSNVLSFLIHNGVLINLGVA